MEKETKIGKEMVIMADFQSAMFEEARTIFFTDEFTGRMKNTFALRVLPYEIMLLEKRSNKSIRVIINSGRHPIDDDAIWISQVMKYANSPIYTLGCNMCISTAALVLMMGEKGKRFAYPECCIILTEPPPLEKDKVEEKEDSTVISQKEIIEKQEEERARRIRQEAHQKRVDLFWKMVMGCCTPSAFKKIKEGIGRNKIFTLSSKEAKKLGIIDHIITKETDFFAD